MNTFIRIRLFALISMIGFISACGPSTRITKTWTDPSVKGTTFKPFTKVLVMARMRDQTGDRIAEDKLAAQFKSGVAVPSYTYLTPADTVPRQVDARLQKDGFDGLVLMRLVDVDKSLNVQNYGYYGYYGWYGGGPTTVTEDRTYVVETSIYSLETGKMLWSGTTSSFNPSSLEKMIDEIIVADKQELMRQGLIKQ